MKKCDKCGSEMVFVRDDVYLVKYYHCIVCGNEVFKNKKRVGPDMHYMEVVLRKMCDIVGFPFSELDVKDKTHRTKTFWSEQQKKQFSIWLLKLLKKSKVAQVQVFGREIKQSRLKKAVERFVEEFGWMSEEEFIKLRHGEE